MSDGKWITLDEADRQRSGEAPSDQRTERERERDRANRRDAGLKARMLEVRIADTMSRTADRDSKRSDRDLESELSTLQDVDRDVLERYHGAVSRFFILGSGVVFAVCVGGLGLFMGVILIGIVLSVFGI